MSRITLFQYKMSLKEQSYGGLKISVYQAEKLSLEQIRMLVSASEGVRFESEHRQQMYGWVESVLVQQEYACQGKAARGLVRRYIEKMAGLSRAQVGQRVHLHRAFVFTDLAQRTAERRDPSRARILLVSGAAVAP